MQVKLWPEVEKGLKEMKEQPDNKRLKLSIAKIANFALAQYVAAMAPKKSK